MMQRYGEKPPIPNIPSDFFLTTRDTPWFLRQNPQMPLISVADDGYFVLFPKNIWSFDNYSYLCNQLQDKSKTMGREPIIKYKEISIQVEI